MADPSDYGVMSGLVALGVIIREGLAALYRGITRNGKTAEKIAARAEARAVHQEEERERVELLAELRKVREELLEHKLAMARHTAGQEERDKALAMRLEGLEREVKYIRKKQHRHSNLLQRLYGERGTPPEIDEDDEIDRKTKPVEPRRG